MPHGISVSPVAPVEAILLGCASPVPPGDSAAGPVWVSYRGFFEPCFTPVLGTASVSLQTRHFLNAGMHISGSRPAFLGSGACRELGLHRAGSSSRHLDIGAGEVASAFALGFAAR